MQIILTRTGTQNYGVNFTRKGSQIEVAYIAPLGIANLADLRAGDVLVRVNNQSCSNLPVSSIELLMTRSPQIILEISRGNSAQTPQSVVSGRSSIPTGSQVIELDSEDEDEDEDEIGHFGYSDEESDLEDDEDDDDMFPRRDWMHRQRVNNSIHRRPTAPPAPPRPIVPYNPGEVVDLLSDDDEPPRRPVQSAPQTSGRPPTAPQASSTLARSLTQPAAAQSSSAAPLARASTATGLMTVQSNLSGAKRSLEPASTPSTSSSAVESSSAKRRKLVFNGVEIKKEFEFEPKKFGEANVGDEVVEVEDEDGDTPGIMNSASKSSLGGGGGDMEIVVTGGAPASGSKAAAAMADDDDFEGDFQIVGGTMQVASDMPHQRYSCTMHPFRVAPAATPQNGYKISESAAMFADRCRMNLQHCLKCYCYVCDMLVSECAEWTTHCHATHKEPKWKIEKDARNSKILSLMTPKNRSAFFQRYKAALTSAASAAQSSASDSDDEYYGSGQYAIAAASSSGLFDYNIGGHYMSHSSNPRDLTNTSNLMNLVQGKLLKSKQLHAGVASSTVSTPNLKPSSSSSDAISECGSSSSSSKAAATDKELFLEASELLMRALTSPRHAGDAPMQVARAFVAWFMHPLCSLDLRVILRTEMQNAQQRTMALNSSIHQGLRELINLDNASVLRLRQKNSSDGIEQVAPLPPQLMNISEQVQALLVPELLDLGNFAAIKQLVALRPNLVPSLLLHHIRKGSIENCREAVTMVYQYCSVKPFFGLRQSLLDVELPQLFRFLAAVIAHNITAISTCSPHAQAAMRQLQDPVTDALFNILMSKIYETIKIEHVPLISTSIDAYFAREAATQDPIRLDNVLAWIETEAALTYNYSPLVVFLYLSYSNWRVNSTIFTSASIVSTIPPMLVSQAFSNGFKFPLLVLLANMFCKYFHVSPQALDTADIHADIYMASHFATRTFDMYNASNKFTHLDKRIRDAWAVLPELKKATPGEMCSSNPSLVTKAYCMVCFADNNTELKFCPSQAFTSRNALKEAVVPSWRVSPEVTSPMRVTATYCDIHHTFDTFLMSLVMPKNTAESRCAAACWGHQLQVHELAKLLPLLEGSQGRKDDASVAGYISFLVSNQELLFVIWKGVLRQMYSYMHAIYHVEVTSMSALLSGLAVVVKPWLSNLDVVTVNQFSAHASCQGLVQAQLVDLQALDQNLRIAYQFSKVLMKCNSKMLTLADVRNFKTSMPRFDAATHPQNLQAKMCQLYLLEYPTVSTRAIWHSFWRRFLLCLVTKRGYTGSLSEEQSVENLSVDLLLEDWTQVKEIISKAPATPRVVRTLVSALAQLSASDVTAMNYGGVSGSQVLKTELDRVLRLKYTVPVLQETPLTHISDKCIECPDSALALLVQQLQPELLQYGALDYQPFFTYALQKKLDSSATSVLATPESIASLNSCYRLVMRAHEDCVAIFSTPGRNKAITYAKVLCGLACLRRYDLVKILVAAGYENLVIDASSVGKGRLKLVVDTLLLAHSRVDFEQLLEVMDSFVSEAYLEPEAFASMAPVIRKFCPSSDWQLAKSSSQASSSSATGSNESARVKLLRFYHSYDAESFGEYWNAVARTQAEKQSIMAWMKKVQGTTRFRTDVHLSVVSLLLDSIAFGEYLNSSELDNPSFDKLHIFTTLVQMVPLNPSMVTMLATAIVRVLLTIPDLTDAMRSSLANCCTETSLPLPSPHLGNSSYSEARTLLLFVSNPQAHVDALADVYLSRSAKEREGMCKVLFSKENPMALIKLLLRIRDYKQLFRMLKNTYYSSVGPNELPSAQAVAAAVDELRKGLTMPNLYNDSATGNSSISAFQKQLFDSSSFTVGLAKFLLLLGEYHIDDRTVVLPEPLFLAVETLIESIRNLVHGDAVVMSYLRLHAKFNVTNGLQFFNDCASCNYATIPFTPTAHCKTKPSTFCLDTLTTIMRAPKFFSVAISYITFVNMLVMTPSQNVLRAGPNVKALVSSLVNSPCRYRRNAQVKTSLSSKGLLWIPKSDSSGASVSCMTELIKLLGSFGADFSDVLEEPILLRLWMGEVHHKFDNQQAAAAASAVPPEGGLPRITLKEWYAGYSESLMRLAEHMKPPTSYSYLVDLMGLYTHFNFATFTSNLFQALSRPNSHLYRRIVLNLLVHAITAKALEMKVALKVLCYEFHHPDNHFGLFFNEVELNLVMDYLQSSEDLRERTRLAIISRDGTPQIPLNSLLKIPRILQLIAKDFTKDVSYGGNVALHHASYFMPLWREIALTSQAPLAYDQAADCFRGICNEFRTTTAQARLRTIFEGLMPGYKAFLENYPDRIVEIGKLKQELKQIVKSKPALVKVLNMLN